jgi:hypothetical protein
MLGLISRARLLLLPLLLPLDSAAEEWDVPLDLQKDPTPPSPSLRAEVELPLEELLSLRLTLFGVGI